MVDNFKAKICEQNPLHKATGNNYINIYIYAKNVMLILISI